MCETVVIYRFVIVFDVIIGVSDRGLNFGPTSLTRCWLRQGSEGIHTHGAFGRVGMLMNP